MIMLNKKKYDIDIRNNKQELPITIQIAFLILY